MKSETKQAGCKSVKLALFIAASLLLSSCGSLYKVKPVIEAPLSEAAKRGEAGGITLRAVPLLTDEESQELFESNLPLGGLLPVRVEIVNSTGAPIELKRARFRLRDMEGREWKYRTPKQAASRILSADDVTLYNPESRRKFEEAFRAHALDTQTPMASAERRQGLIFFQTPKKEAVTKPIGLVLTVERVPQPIEIRLN